LGAGDPAPRRKPWAETKNPKETWTKTQAHQPPRTTRPHTTTPVFPPPAF
jgi:hypothetical protein